MREPQTDFAVTHTPKKKYGQNFLIGPDIPEKIVAKCGVGCDSEVLEIGPGRGVLTEVLCRHCKRVVSVEIDRTLEPLLENVLASHENLNVVFDDILKLDIEKLADENFEGHFSVVANLPYYITTPIITKLIRISRINSITIMVQKEVARRLTASPGSSDYGSFTVFVNYFCTAEKLFDVPRGCFRPIPGVDSSVVKLLRRDEPVVHPSDEPTFFKVIAAAFGQRRKTLANSLGAVFDKKIALEALTASGIAPNTRGEQLSIVQFFQIGEHLFKLLQPSLTAKRL